MQRHFIVSTAFILLVGSFACSSARNADDTNTGGNNNTNGDGTGSGKAVVTSTEPSALAATESSQAVDDDADTSANAQNYGSSGYGVSFIAKLPTLIGNPNRGGRDNGPGHRPDCMHVQGMAGGNIDPNAATVAFSLNFDNCQSGDQNNTMMDGNCTVTLTHNPNDPNGPATIGFGIDANRHFPDGSNMNIHGLPRDGGHPAVTVDTNGTIAANGNSVVTRTITAFENRVRTLNGNVILDMNVTVEAVTTVDAYTDGTLVSRVVNGNTLVHHNILKMTSTHAFTNVTEVFSACDCYPISGTIEQTTTLDSDPNTVVLDRTFTFTSTCGTVDVDTTVSTDPNILTGTATLTLDACQN